MECVDGDLSLLSLEDELTCSICLSAFDCPVTIPCGHNFCQNCLLSIWTDTYRCPQCRSHFTTKPELKKNTVLATVVQTFKMKQIRGEDIQVEEVQAQKQAVIHCDTCMDAEASQTCFTCMASFCEEHLRPHLENPRFQLHQLNEAVSDLSERICPDHHKMFELFCTQHDRLICSLCLQQAHKGCDFVTTEERRNAKEADLRDKLCLMDGKIEKNEAVFAKTSDIQSKLKEAAADKKRALVGEYQQMRDLLDGSLSEALSVVDLEQASGRAKLGNQMKKFTTNVEKMSKAKEEICSLLKQSQTLAFLQASFDLPSVVKFDPYVPQIRLDSKKVTAVQNFAAVLKEQLTELFKQPVEARLPMINTDVNAGENKAAASATQSGTATPADSASTPGAQGGRASTPGAQGGRTSASRAQGGNAASRAQGGRASASRAQGGAAELEAGRFKNGQHQKAKSPKAIPACTTAPGVPQRHHRGSKPHGGPNGNRAQRSSSRSRRTYAYPPEFIDQCVYAFYPDDLDYGMYW